MSALIPNLFLLGLPKAGTSSLFSNLVRHPGISGSEPKETFYLLDKDHPLLNQTTNYWRDGIQGWKQFYNRTAAPLTPYYIEATTHTFFQGESIQELKRTAPDAKFIILLHEPAERIYSSFIYTRDTLVRMPASISFKQYADDLIAGRKMDYISHDASRYVLQRELVYSNYASWLEAWSQLFHSEQFFIGLFEEGLSQTCQGSRL